MQGFTNGAVKFVDKKTACYTCGKFIVFLNVETKTRKTLQSPGSGIGAFTASGYRRCLAFSDLGLNPSIFVYKYPEFELMSELKGQSMLNYTFNQGSSKWGPGALRGTQVCARGLVGKFREKLVKHFFIIIID